MDFNTIYEVIKPYLGTGAIASGILAIFVFALKVLGVVKEIKTTFTSTENEAVNAFKKAIPKELYLSIETITKTELAKIIEHIKQIVDQKFLSQIKANTELTQAIASALITMKAIPDSSKKEIAKLLEIKDVETTESLIVELLPIEETKPVKVSDKILID